MGFRNDNFGSGNYTPAQPNSPKDAATDIFKDSLVSLKKKGFTDAQIEAFIMNPCAETFGLTPDPYRDYYFVQIKTYLPDADARIAIANKMREEGQV